MSIVDTTAVAPVKYRRVENPDGSWHIEAPDGTIPLATAQNTVQIYMDGLITLGEAEKVVSRPGIDWTVDRLGNMRSFVDDSWGWRNFWNLLGRLRKPPAGKHHG